MKITIYLLALLIFITSCGTTQSIDKVDYLRFSIVNVDNDLWGSVQVASKTKETIEISLNRGLKTYSINEV